MAMISHVDLSDLNSEFIFYVRLAYQVDYNIYYNHYKNSLDDDIQNKLQQKKQEYQLKISNIGEINSDNKDKFIMMIDNRLVGYIKYQQTDGINVDSIYGETDDIIKELLKELFKSKDLHFKHALCNLDLDSILKDVARTITIEDFKKDPDLLTKLTKDQLAEISLAIKSKQNMDDYKVDNSETDYSPSPEKVGFQKVITNGHSIVENDQKKQGFVDALVLALLSGFTAGVFSTLLVIFIKLKTGM